MIGWIRARLAAKRRNQRLVKFRRMVDADKSSSRRSENFLRERAVIRAAGRTTRE